MTRATYNSDNTLTELPGIEKPDIEKYNGDYFLFYGPWKAYEAQLAKCRTIPCSPECRGLWAEGQVLEEGKDYEVRKMEMRDTGYPFEHCEQEFAFPLVPVKSEDNWLTTKPTFTEECILITASKVRDQWHYNFWLIEKLDNMEEGWYWGILCPDGDEWGDLADLQAEKYLVIPKLTH